ncbi:MAG: hypothetical protein H6744_20625 [Deltaproteobacteria bacterium]|nr:hypothetical protein [Deltaproteobacteria bacterium]
MDAWAPATFTGHDAFWPLTGAHADATCAACHTDGVYAGTPKLCSSCHEADFEAATEPDHVKEGISQACEVCHDTAAWKPARFDHDSAWPLTGAHVVAACSSCHEGGVYAGTSRDCEGCHVPEWQTAEDPDHVALDLPKTCEACHATAAWAPADYAGHDAVWPLLGKHRDATCESCHADGYRGTPTACDDCHHPDYVGAEEPDHTGEGFPLSCETCHAATGWEPSIFDHESVWPLTGAHVEAACSSCHQAGDYADTPEVCVGCHQADFDASSDPDHTELALPTTCEVCHGTGAWSPAEFGGHDAVWPLLGEHADATCESCHADGYVDTPTACDGCHHPDYVDAKEPDHVAEAYPTACETCHTEAGWEPSIFDHQEVWPLTGAHVDAACASCHVAGVYDDTPELCVGCHQEDYDGSADPDHAALGLAQTCDDCHGTIDWATDTFTGHAAIWPLVGKHADATCQSCHAGSTSPG